MKSEQGLRGRGEVSLHCIIIVVARSSEYKTQPGLSKSNLCHATCTISSQATPLHSNNVTGSTGENVPAKRRKAEEQTDSDSKQGM